MDFVRGLVVRALAGQDKGGFFTVLEASGDMAVICNGKRRSLHIQRERSKTSSDNQDHLGRGFIANQP